MQFLDHDIAPLGMGCWPIGGAMFRGGEPLGYANANDEDSIRTVHAALASGITLFDTAAAYGAGHAERLLARALKGRPEALIVTKIGVAIDEETKQLTGVEMEPESVLPAIEAALRRLARDRIDLVLLHQNDFPLPTAEAFFDELDKARAAGKIRAYGWSSDFAARVDAAARRAAFVAVEHAMNVLMDAPRMRAVVRKNQLVALIRSPLAMGLLTGKYDADSVMPAEDIRSTSNPMTDYFANARANPRMLAQIETVRELLTVEGRSLTQGAIGWLWAKGELNLPVPGARTVTQIEGIAEALSFGALPEAIVAQIDGLIEREPEASPDRER